MSIIQKLQKDLDTKNCIVSEKIQALYKICKELDLEEFALILESEINGYDENESIPEHRQIKLYKMIRIESKKKRNRYGILPGKPVSLPNNETNPYLHLLRYVLDMEVIDDRVTGNYAETGSFMFYADIKTLESFIPKDENDELDEFILMQIEYFLERTKDMLIELLKGFEDVGVLGEGGIFTSKEKKLIQNF